MPETRACSTLNLTVLSALKTCRVPRLREHQQALAACRLDWHSWRERDPEIYRQCRTLNPKPLNPKPLRKDDTHKSRSIRNPETLNPKAPKPQKNTSPGRKSSTVTLSFTDSFPYMPPQAMSAVPNITTAFVSEAQVRVGRNCVRVDLLRGATLQRGVACICCCQI